MFDGSFFNQRERWEDKRRRAHSAWRGCHPHGRRLLVEPLEDRRLLAEQWIPFTSPNPTTFNGTSGDEVFAFSTDGAYHYVSVTLAGQPTQNYTYLASDPVTLTFNGGGGNDKLTIDGGPLAETVATHPNSVTFSGPTGTYQVVSSDIDDIRVTAGTGTGQTATIYDSAGSDDTFTSRPTYCEMSGAGHYEKVTGFGPVDAYASGDAGDTAKFYDSPAADTFSARPAFPALRLQSLAQMACPGYATNVAHGFSRQFGYGSFVYGQPGQGDRANLYDGPGNETWIGYGPLNYSEMTGPGGLYYVRAQGFDLQYGYVTGGGTGNVARFYDTPGDDVFNAKGDYSYLAGVNNETWWFASGFQRVYAQKTSGGGYDRAFFSHTTGAYKATYNVRSYQGYMADSAGTFFNLASDFKEYWGVSMIPDNTDEAYLRTTGGGDTVTSQPVGSPWNVVQVELDGNDPGTGKPVHEYAWGFKTNVVMRKAEDSSPADTAFDTATLTGTSGNDTFVGAPTDSTLTYSTGQTVRLTYWPTVTRPRGFDKITVNGNGEAFLSGSQQIDTLQADQDWAELAGPAQAFVYRVAGFHRVQVALTSTSDMQGVRWPSLNFELDLQWIAQDLGPAVRAVSYDNSEASLAQSPLGAPGMFYTSYYFPSGAALVGFDPGSGELVQAPIPSQGGYGIAVGADGAVYVGGMQFGDLYRFDPQTGQMRTLGGRQFGAVSIWSCEASTDGRKIYAAFSPNAGVLQYDVDTGTLVYLGRMSDTRQYPESLAVAPSGKLWVGIGTPADLVVWDPATNTRHSVLPPEYQGDLICSGLSVSGNYVSCNLVGGDLKQLIFDATTEQIVAVLDVPPEIESYKAVAGGHDGSFYLSASLGGALYRYRVGDTAPQRLADDWFGRVLIVKDDRYVYALDDQQFVYYDLAQQRELLRRKLVEAPDGTPLSALTSGADGKIYGGTYINMHVFSVTPETGAIQDLGRATRWDGQVEVMYGAPDGKIYMASYIRAVVSVYDPSQPWNPGTGADNNPREIGPLGSGQYRPYCITLGPDNRIYVGSVPSYGSAPTGAFSQVDPATGTVRTWFDLVPAGTVTGVIADQRYVYGAGNGKFFVFSTDTDEVVLSLDLEVSAMTFAPNGQVVGTGGGQLFVFDPEQAKVVYQSNNPFGDFTQLVLNAHGYLYGINSQYVVQITPAAWSFASVLAPGGEFLAAGPDNDLYIGRRSHLFRFYLAGAGAIPADYALALTGTWLEA